MTPDLKSLGIDQLSIEERLSLMIAIGDTIPAATLTPAQEQELDRRLDELDAGRANLIPAAEVEAQMRARFTR